ncbi:MAG: hypothetical protein RL115_2490 [Bacteroidota bacterium]|jgi:hypothetical protein
MKKIIIFFSIILITMSKSFGSSYAPNNKGKYEISNTADKNQLHDTTSKVELSFKPVWDCWAFNIPGCASGWSCAENIHQATAQVAAIIINYCINGGDYANCQ